MMDEPVPNPRYGGITMREMVRTVVLRKGDPGDDSITETEIIEQKWVDDYQLLPVTPYL